jgi:Flp pilus assembly protein CpaB
VVAAVLALAAVWGGRGDGPPAPDPLVQAVVLRRSVAPGHRIAVADLALVRMSRTALPPGQLTDPVAATGRLAAVAMPAGAPLMAPELVQHRSAPSDRDVALRLDSASGLPAGPLAGMRADLYAVAPGNGGVHLVLANALVVATSAQDGTATATLRVPDRLVRPLIQAESGASLRLVVVQGAAS